MTINPKGIVSLIEYVGENSLRVQPLTQCMTNIKAVKGGSKITFETNQLTATEVALANAERVALIVWLPADGVEAWRKSTASAQVSK